MVLLTRYYTLLHAAGLAPTAGRKCQFGVDEMNLHAITRNFLDKPLHAITRTHLEMCLTFLFNLDTSKVLGFSELNSLGPFQPMLGAYTMEASPYRLLHRSILDCFLHLCLILESLKCFSDLSSSGSFQHTGYYNLTYISILIC